MTALPRSSYSSLIPHPSTLLRTLRRSALSLSIAVLATVGAHAAEPIANIIPGDSQVYATLNARQLIDSAIFQKIYKEKVKDQQRAQLEVLNGIVGFDVMKDVDRVHAWGLVKQEESFCAAIDGKLNQEKLTTLVKANKGFQETKEGEATVYRWIDDNEGKERFGTFVSADRLVIGNTLESLRKSLAAKGDRKSSAASASNSDKFKAPSDATFYAFLASPANLEAPGDFEGLKDLSNATVKGAFTDSGLDADARLDMKSAESAKNLGDMIIGLMALGRMQSDNPELKDLLGGVSVDAPAGGTTIAVKVTVPQAKLLEIADKADVDVDASGNGESGIEMEVEASTGEKAPAEGAK